MKEDARRLSRIIANDNAKEVVTGLGENSRRGRALGIFSSGLSFFSPALDKRETGTAFVTPAPGPTEKPVCHRDHLGCLFPVVPFVCVLDDVVENAPFFVKLKLEESSELLVWTVRSSNNACDLFNNVTDLAVIFFTTCLPSYNQSLVPHVS